VFEANEKNLSSFQKEVSASVSKGEYVVFVPGKAKIRSGTLTSVSSETLSFLLKGDVPTIGLYVDHPASEKLTIEEAKMLKSAVLSFGNPLPKEKTELADYQEELLLAAQAAFNTRPALEMNLAYALLMGLKKHGTQSHVFDGFQVKETPFDKLLAAAIVLSKVIRQETQKDRVGVVLPPGTGGLLANIAVLFAGKTPVNLNFTAGESSIKSAMEQADLDRLITADPFVRKTQRFPWPPTRQLIFLERTLPQLKAKIALWLIASKFMPLGALANAIGISKTGGDEEAVLLFTSGSSGEPKGVALTHRNVMANVNQFSSRLRMGSQDSVLGCLPLFHSFGCTVTMWYPVIEGINLVTYPTPLETPKLAELIEEKQVSLLVATPTFLRGYLRKAKREQLSSLQLVVTGAEKLPAKIAEDFEKKFGKPVLEGYGLTETSPVSNVNLPDPASTGGPEPILPSHRRGSVGQLIPGMALRITDPDTDEPMSIHQSGMIWLSGPNVFPGYLNMEEKSKEVIKEGWLKTGDIGRMDGDGFLYIEGRLSRFSKIAGEMVPHETIEDSINRELGVDSGNERQIAIVGIPDESKGEALVLISAASSLEATDLRYRLLEAGLPSLWIPKQIIKVQEIPHLASGKLDIKHCQAIAKNGGELE
ncbi:MAG: AMP-binding protein, partial [Verrucomicrobiota bacterium]